MHHRSSYRTCTINTIPSILLPTKQSRYQPPCLPTDFPTCYVHVPHTPTCQPTNLPTNQPACQPSLPIPIPTNQTACQPTNLPNQPASLPISLTSLRCLRLRLPTNLLLVHVQLYMYQPPSLAISLPTNRTPYNSTDLPTYQPTSLTHKHCARSTSTSYATLLDPLCCTRSSLYDDRRFLPYY